MGTTEHPSSQLSANMVAVMYAPVALTAVGWLLAVFGYDGEIDGLFALGLIAMLCGVVLAVPMTGIALYRAIKVDTRPIIWSAALLDAAVILPHCVLLYVASR